MSVNAAIVSGTTYYLQNKASGKYISSGHAWFTRSTLSLVMDYPIIPQASGDGFILKVVGSNQLGYNLFVDNGDNKAWTITEVDGEEGVYTIANGTKYLGSDGTLVLSDALTDPTSDAAKWYFRTKDDYLALFANASAENPVDASFYITGPSFDYTDPNRGNAWTMSGFSASTELGRDGNKTAINPYVVERYSNTGSIKQTLTGLKKGMYGISVYGYYRAGNNNTATAARAAGTEAQNAILYAGSKEKPLMSIYDQAQPSSVSGSFNTSTSYGFVPNARSTAGEAFANGYYKNTIYLYVESDDASLEIGVKKDATIAEDWCCIDNWCITYYGSEELTETEIVLAASIKDYKKALSDAQAYQSVDMLDADKTALNNAITANTIDLTGSLTEEQLTTATANLKAAAAAADKASKKYEVYTDAKALIEDKNNVDLTSLLVNAGFETGDMTGWTSVDGGAQANNKNFSKMSGDHFVERWRTQADNAGLTNGSLTHDVVVLPVGVYKITAEAQNIKQYDGNKGGKGYFLCANDEKKEIGDAATYTVYVELAEAQDLTIKFLLDNCEGNWISCDNVTLTYLSTDWSTVYELAKTEAQDVLDSDDYVNVTGEERTALSEAINAEVATTQEGVLAALDVLAQATQAFNAAKADYDKFAELKKDVEGLVYADADKKAAVDELLNVEPANVEEVKEILANEALTQKLRVCYESNALAEGQENVQNITSRIQNPNATEGMDGWVLKGNARVLSNEPLTDASGNSTYSYFDSNQWGDNAWDISLSQDISLPKGKYLLTVASRASAGLTSFKLFANPVQAEMARKMAMIAEQEVTGNAIEMKLIGASGGVFDRGWNDATLAFELDEDAVVNIGVQGVTDQVHQWMSFTRFRMVQLDAPAAGKIKDLEEKLDEAMTLINNNPSADEQRLFDLIVAYNDGLNLLETFKKGAEVSFDDVAAAVQAPDDAMRNLTSTTGISTVSTVQDGSTIYNLGGQMVNNLRKGVYIINGKKVVK